MDNYVFSMKNTIEDPEKLANKLDDDEKNTIKEALTETENWIKENTDPTKEEYEE